jgi:hypothetical protein
MRLAAVAATLTTALVTPFVLAVSGPQMSEAQFLSAVRCTAYENVFAPRADLSGAKMQLNAEARRQLDATVDRAFAEVDAVARRAGSAETAAARAQLHAEQLAACAGASVLAGGLPGTEMAYRMSARPTASARKERS